jgi:hypothetical protein
MWPENISAEVERDAKNTHAISKKVKATQIITMA